MSAKKKLDLSIDIHASRDRIWHTVVDDETFRQWCAVYHPGSYYKGDWNEGSIIRFLGPNEDGTESGMITKVAAHRFGEYWRGEHIGVILNDVDLYEGKDVEDWIPAEEEYTLSGGPDVFTLRMRNDIPSGEFDWFKEKSEEGLSIIKKLAES